MKINLKIPIIISFILVELTSCEKEKGCANCEVNKKKPIAFEKPIAFAGSESYIVLPKDSLILSGNASYDPDGNIVKWKWGKIFGPSQFQIKNPNHARTIVNNLTPGVYEFELKVTDNDSLVGLDTVKFVVYNESPTGDFCLLPFAINVGKFTSPKFYSTSTVCDNKFYYVMDSVIDVFDPATNIISNHSLSMSRESISAVSTGNTVLFAGGYIPEKVSPVSRVDIFDVNTKIFKIAELSLARFNICAATMGAKVFFAGGNINVSGSLPLTSRVDVYDSKTNTWSFVELSQPGVFVSTVIGTKIWFVTNSNVIDVYDEVTNQWSVLNVGFSVYDIGPDIYNMKAITLNNKTFFTGSQVVRIYDVSTNSWSSISLPEKKYFIPAAISNNKIAFIGGFYSQNISSEIINIYDPATNSFKELFMNCQLRYANIISYNNYIFNAGGLIPDKSDPYGGDLPLFQICKFRL